MQKELTENEINKVLHEFDPAQENIIKVLHKLQDAHPQQYISEKTLDLVASYFKNTKAQLYGIVSYYSMFSFKPRGRYIIRLCKSPVCNMMGSLNILNYLKQLLKISPGETTVDGFFTLEFSECLGRCGKAPSMMINKEVYTELSEEKIANIILQLKAKP